MRRYFFERPARKEPGKTGRSREKPERNGEKGRAGNSARAAMSEMPDNAARAGRRHGSTVARWHGGGRQAAGWQVSGGLQVAGSRQTARQSGGGQQKIGGGWHGRQSARAGGSIALKGRFHVHTNSDYRAPELWHSNGPRQRESGNDPEPAPPRSGKKHAGKQVLSTEIPRIHWKRDIRRPLTNYH